MPVRGLGEKNVVFWGIRTRSTAAARVWATDTGRHRIAALDHAFVDELGDGLCVMAVLPRRSFEARDDQRLDDRGVGVRDGGMLGGQRGLTNFRPGHRECEPAIVHDAEAVLGVHRRFQRIDAVGGVRARVAQVERIMQGGSDVGPAGQVDETVNRLDPQLVVDELHDEGHDRVGAMLPAHPPPAARCGS